MWSGAKKCGFLGRPRTASYPFVRQIPVYSFIGLCNTMKTRARITILRHDFKEVVGLVNGIKPEGAANSWIVTICKADCTYEDVWVKTD